MISEAKVRLLVRRAMHVPLPDDSWLSASERTDLAGFRIDKRRGEWRLGRWTAKHLVAEECGLNTDTLTLSRIEIRPADDGAPEPLLDGRPLDLALSISHSAGFAACVVAPGSTRIGVDIELIRALRRGTVAHHYTAAEQALLQDLEPHDWALRGTLLWTAKESALKALRQGLRLDTRTVEASPALRESSSLWHGLEVKYVPEDRPFRGWWRRLGDHVLSVVAEPAARLPVEMELKSSDQPT